MLVVLDGTWREAKKMFVRSPVLQRLPAIHLDLRRVERKSEYVVRTQPTEQCLSTVEIVAHTVAILENDDSIVDKLVAPLRALCSIQVFVQLGLTALDNNVLPNRKHVSKAVLDIIPKYDLYLLNYYFIADLT